MIDFTAKTPLFLVNPQSNPFELRSHLIHKFLCSYYLLGKTEIHIKVRAGEHSSASVPPGKMPSSIIMSTDKDHCFQSGHMTCFADFVYLCCESV